MKRWYLFYYKQVIKGHQVGDQFEDIEKGQQVAGQIKGFEKSQQVVDQLETANRQQAVDEKGQQVVGQLQFPDTFGLIPWGCHILIISKCQSLDEAMFYINKVVEEGWSRSRLEAQVAANLFGSQGAALTNFEHTLPAPQSQLAKELLKDPYHFEFLSMGEEDEEQDLEDALVSNVTRFLMELGQGFSYVGRQMELQMPGGQTFFPDLLFYHIPQHRYVVTEMAKRIPPDYKTNVIRLAETSAYRCRLEQLKRCWK